MERAGVLYFLSDPSTSRAEARAAAPDDRFVALSWEAETALVEEGRRPSTVRSLLDGKARGIEADACRMSRRWHRDAAGRDVTEMDGVSLGEAHFSPLWIFCFLPGVKNFVLARAALDLYHPRSVRADPASAYFLRSAVRLLSSARGVPADVPLNEDSPGAAVMKDVLGPGFSWRPHRPSFARDVFLRKTFNLFSAVARLFHPPRRPRLLIGYYPTLRSLFEALFSAPWRGRFAADLLDFPQKALAPAAFLAGVRLRPCPAAVAGGGDAAKAADLLGACRDAWDEMAADPAFFVGGENIFPLLRPVLEDYWRENLPGAVATASQAARLLESGRYAAVVSPIDSMPHRGILLETARRRGVKTVTMSHGIGYISRAANEGFRSDVVTVEGPGTKRLYQACGLPPDRVWDGCGGIFDRHAARRSDPSPALRRKILVLTNPQVLLAADSYPGDAEEYARRVLSIVERLAGAEATLKLHPVEAPAYYERFLGRPVRLEHAAPLADLLDSHGTVVGTASTALIEAAVRGRRVVGVNFFGADFPAPFDGASGLPMARSDEELRARLEEALSPAAPPDDGRLLRDFAGALDGRQAFRFLERLAGWLP